MISKLKFLKAYWNRTVVPAAGSVVGKILYTSKNTTGRRKQIVIDVDANTTKFTTINAQPADPKTFPGEIVERTVNYAPKTDANLYIFGSIPALPVISNVPTVNFTQTIANGGTITAVNVLDGVKINAVAATAADVVITALVEAGLTLNETTGDVTLDDNLTAGTYTVTYKVEHVDEPSVYITGIITVTVQA
ncbi:MAG: hypothetical protein E6R13_08050 [Spirochaetes bacterium]|nr:MAG: hypothetical protein E6R13_08050 [Spirochaetota bacterium]